MQVHGHVHGGTPIIKKFFASAQVIQGVPVKSAELASAAGDSGAVIIIANAAGNPIIGLTNDANDTWPSNPEAQLNTDVSLQVTVNVRPDAIYRAKLSGSATVDTALSNQACNAASALGITAANVTTLDDGVIWGYTGANAGVIRRCDSTAGSLSMGMSAAIASGDEFIAAQGFMGYVSTSQAYFDLTSDFSQVRVDAADSDNDNFVIFDWELRDFAGTGVTNSYYHLLPWKHAFSGSANQS